MKASSARVDDGCCCTNGGIIGYNVCDCSESVSLAPAANAAAAMVEAITYAEVLPAGSISSQPYLELQRLCKCRG